MLVRTQPFELTVGSPSMDRWMYPHNATPGSRTTAPVFGTLGDESGVDSRHGQFLIGFDLSSLVPTNLGPSRYLIRTCRLSVNVSRDRSFALDPTTDSPATYLPTDHPDSVPDPDAGRPVELFGVGYRHGFTADSFLEDAPFGNPAVGLRNAYAAGFDDRASLVDVGNSVGKTNSAFPSFDAIPFAVGNAAALPPGELVPAGTTLDFDLNLADPLVAQYLQQACHTGKLRLMLTSLQTSGFGGQPAWAEFHTRESVLGDPPRLLLSGTTVRAEDTDRDQLPDDWERFHFGSLAATGSGDTDQDGLADGAEWEAGTNPNHALDTLAFVLHPASGTTPASLRFRHAPSRRYELETSVDLRSWEAAHDSELRYEVGTAWGRFSWPTAIQPVARFFRVKATPLLSGQP